MKSKESGMVSAELAIAIPIIVAVLVLVASFGQALVTHMRVTEAAREAARAVAIGDESAARQLVRSRAGPEASMSVHESGSTVEVRVHVPIGGLASPLDLVARADSVALVEWR